MHVPVLSPASPSHYFSLVISSKCLGFDSAIPPLCKQYVMLRMYMRPLGLHLVYVIIQSRSNLSIYIFYAYHVKYSGIWLWEHSVQVYLHALVTHMNSIQAHNYILIQWAYNFKSYHSECVTHTIYRCSRSNCGTILKMILSYTHVTLFQGHCYGNHLCFHSVRMMSCFSGWKRSDMSCLRSRLRTNIVV